MERHEARFDMIVVFGRHHGEKTLGQIVKLNPSKARVKTLEQRGSVRVKDEGQIWGVPYSLMRPATPEEIKAASANQQTPVANPKPLPVSLDGGDEHILLAIHNCYVGLSPENLHCDGEISHSAAMRRAGEIRRKLQGLFTAFGRTVTEDEVDAWYDKKYRHKTPA
jgi:hypothetical protein